MTKHLLRLYIAGESASSRRAERNMAELRSRVPGAAWDVEIIDVLANPERAEQAGVLATPTLSYENSTRPRRIVGDLSDTARVLAFLGIEPKRDEG